MYKYFGVIISDIPTNDIKKLDIVDVSSNRKLLGMLLSKRGMNVFFAEDGLQAVQMCDSHPPDFFDFVFMVCLFE